eukprot:scaffold451_cov184-Amphora_coffeaeformis.AAC.3
MKPSEQACDIACLPRMIIRVPQSIKCVPSRGNKKHTHNRDQIIIHHHHHRTNMKVAEFMTSADKAVTASPFDTIRKVMDSMLAHKVGAVVIVGDKSNERKEGKKVSAVVGTSPSVCGIITKSDILQAYHYSHICIDHPCLEIMSSQELGTCTPEMSLDEAARVLTKNNNHHAIVVVDQDHQRFAGVLSSWDITYAYSQHHPEQAEENKIRGHNHHSIHAKHQQNFQQGDGDSKFPSIPLGGPLADPATGHSLHFNRATSERQVGRCAESIHHRTRAISERNVRGRPTTCHHHLHHTKSQSTPMGRPGIDFSAGMHHDLHCHDSFRCFLEDLSLMLSLE